MQKKNFLYSSIWIISTLLIVILDQITKYLVVQTMNLYDEFSVIRGFFKIVYVRNPGAGLGILSNARWVFISFTFIIIFLAIILLVKNYFKNSLANTALIFILGGGIGNMIDRLAFGEVVDFFQFQIKYLDFIFNVADIFVTFGTVLFVIYYLFIYNKKTDEVNKNESDG